MPKKRKTLWRKRVGLLLIALLLPPVTYSTLHYAHGGTTEQLLARAQVHLAAAQHWASGAWQQAQQVAAPKPLGAPAPAPAKPETPAAAPANPATAAPATIRTSPDPAPVTEAPAGAPIEVFFGPTTEAANNGIDDRFLQFLGTARKTIDCAFYEFELESVAELLIAKHKGGVQVRIVTDSDYEDREALRKCNAAGIHVALDKRRAFMHDKFAVVDGQAVWTGSTNITSNGMYRNNNNSVILRSRPMAVNYTTEFDEMFIDRRFGNRSRANTPYPVLDIGNCRVACYFSPDDGVAKAILNEIAATQRSIDVMAFAFTSQPIAEAMAARMAQGVKVRVLLEQRSSGGEHPRDDYLRQHGAQILYDKNPYAMHHKVMILDQNRVITGSYNFSKNAEEDNDENLLIFYAPDIAKAYEIEFATLTAP